MPNNNNTKTIFIADDDRLNIMLIKKLLKRFNYNIITACNGKEAEQLIIKNAALIDIILLDVMMPFQSGIEVCKALKKSPTLCEIPVLFITSMDKKSDILKGFAAGGVDYITKPFNEAELVARINTHMKLRLSEKQLQLLNERKDKFISIIANEFDGPINSLKGIFQLLLDHFEQFTMADIKEYIALSYASVDNFKELLSNMQLWCQLHTNDMAYNPGKFALEVLVASACKTQRSMAEQKKLTINCRINKEIMVYADYDMIFIVLRNLIANALKFSFESGEIDILSEIKDNHIILCVVDRGIGINDEDQKNLLKFENQFKQLGTSGEIGSGIGLLLCHDLVKKNGGTIWINSKPNVGTSVFFTLLTA